MKKGVCRELVLGERGVEVVDKEVSFVERPEEVMRGLVLESLSLPYVGSDVESMGLTYGEVITRKLVKQASDGDYKCMKEVLDRIMGKSVEKKISLEGNLDSFLDRLGNKK